MFRLFRKKQKKPNPPWMMWVAIAFLGYVLIANGGKKTVTNSTDPETSIGAEKENTNPSLGSMLNPEKIMNIDVIKDRVFPQATVKLQMKDNVVGDGKSAVCGQKATIKYNSFTEDGKEIEKQQKAILEIGSGSNMSALEKGVVGMKEKGKRSIFSSGKMAYGEEKFTREDVPTLANIRFDVELLELSPELPDYSAYRIIGERSGNNSVYLCGTQAKINFSIWDVEGKKLYDSKEGNSGMPFVFTIGKSEVFLGLEQGVLGMGRKENRVLVVPSTLQKTMYDKKSAIDFPFPSKQTVLVYVESLP